MHHRGQREAMCEIGRRIYQKGFAAGFDGNLSCRLSGREILCTPTMVSKGYLVPEELCVIDYSGNQLAGPKKRTSEILIHLEVYRARPEVEAVVHCHPPHAVAFSLVREPIPQCVLPEVELCLGEVPTVRYETPGTEALAAAIRPFISKACILLLASHGTLSWGKNLEQACWWTEILDGYCRILTIARELGEIHYLSASQVAELLEIKKKWGFEDPRFEAEYQDCDLCGNDVFRESWSEASLAPNAFAPQPTTENTDKFVELVTQLVLKQLQSHSQASLK